MKTIIFELTSAYDVYSADALYDCKLITCHLEKGYCMLTTYFPDKVIEVMDRFGFIYVVI